MKYQKLAETYQKLESTSKRLEKTSILSEFLKEIPEKDKDTIYLLVGRIYPDYDERKIGISEKLIIKALSKSTGTSSEKIVKEWKEIGDLGEVAKKLTSKKSQSTLQSHTLTTQKVIENLRKLPELEGKGTIDKKISIITELLTSATPLEALYLTRTVLGDLRIGIQESTIRDSLTEAFFKDQKEAKKIIQEAIDKSNDLSEVFEIAKKKDLSNLEEVKISVGKPMKVMLSQKVSTIEEGFSELGTPCALEYKYDGFRMIIHKIKGETKLYTRRLEEVTKQFPEAIEYVDKYVKGESFILDTEVVGYDNKTKEYLPFQSISQRIRRKYEIEKLRKELPIEINVFDILYYEGESFLEKPFEERTKFLRKIIENKQYKIIHSRQIIASSIKEAKEFYKKSLDDNQEGIMMKSLNAEYKPGRRVGYMLKLKPEERDYDLVITAAEYGTGKRSGWMSSFYLSCKSGEKYLEVGKVSTGLKEKETEKTGGTSFEELTEKLNPYIEKEKGRWVELKPKIVVSVTYQEIQKSPNYESGYALRFPRFTALRPEKPASEITTLEEIEKDHEAQKRK